MEVIVVIIVIAFIVMIARAGTGRQVSSSWQDVAEKLGVRATSGGFRQRSRLAGRFHGFDVRVHTFTRGIGNAAQPFTVYRVRYRSLRLGLRLRRQDAFTGIAKLLGSDDHVIGHASFDENVVIGARSLPAVRAYLTSERRSSVLRAMMRWPGLEITDTEIKLMTRGAETRSARIEERVRNLCDLARVLSREGEAQYTPRSREEGRKVTGLAQEVRKVAGVVGAAVPPPVPAPSPPPVAPPPLPVSEPEPTEEPEPVVEAPPVEEPQPSPEPSWEPEPAPEPAPEPVPEPPDEPEEEVAPAPGDVDLVAVCTDLFGSGTMGSESDRIFDEKYADRTVRWSGTLDRVDSYYRDSIFGDGPATRIVLLVHEIVEDRYGSREVHAVVQLPEDAADPLRSRRGEVLAFEGRLAGSDTFMRHLFVADGRILE